MGRMKDLCNCAEGISLEQANKFRVSDYAKHLPPLTIEDVPHRVEQTVRSQAARPRGLGDVVATAIKTVTFGKVTPCGGCKKRQETLNRLVPFKQKGVTWSYGVTAVKQRLRDGLLERTLNSLKQAGFDHPRLFIDGDNRGFERFGLPMTHRAPLIKPVGNWYLGLLELTIREPHADRYAMFQDDFVCCRNLREYLSTVEHPSDGYLNLCTYPANHKLANGREGFYHSTQEGLGAQALVFTASQARALLTHEHMIHKPIPKPKYPNRDTTFIDGGVVESFKKMGMKEYVHSPSLVFHTGNISSIRNARQPQTAGFRGEDWDPMSLLKEQDAAGTS